MRPTIISISGLSSNVGKTTLLCNLLKCLPGAEAIKVSRGHYRSCGKNPEACCISPMLGENPLVLSGSAETCVPGKDTGRYWQAGATGVHWVICTSEQVEEGVGIALSRTRSSHVFIEGTSFLKFIPADYSIMVACLSMTEIKSSAARVMNKMDAVFVSGSDRGPGVFEELQSRVSKRGYTLPSVPLFFESNLNHLADEIKRIHKGRLSAISCESAQPTFLV